MKRMRIRNPDRLDLFAVLLLLAIIPAIVAPLLSRGIRGKRAIVPQSDYPTHSVLAAELREQKRIMIPHPFYHLTLIGVQWGLERFTGHSQSATAKSALGTSHGEVSGEVQVEVSNQYATAAIITNVFFVWLLSLIFWMQIRPAANIRTAGGVLAGVALVLGLILVAPIALLHRIDTRYYFGYIGINVWHNPTVIAAKPFALLTFLATIAVFPDRSNLKSNLSLPAIFSLAILVIVGATVKPSYLMCLIPATLFLAVWRQGLRGQPVRWACLLVGLVLPTLLMLGWQNRIYSRYTGGSHPVFAPLLTMSALSRHLAPKLLLSIVFPLACYLAWFREARSRTRLNLAWMAFGVGLLFTYLIAETQRATHGNFLWGAQLALLLLFVESTLFALEKVRSGEAAPPGAKGIHRRFAFCMILFAFHVVSGVIYYAHLISTHRGNSWLKSYWWYH